MHKQPSNLRNLSHLLFSQPRFVMDSYIGINVRGGAGASSGECVMTCSMTLALDATLGKQQAEKESLFISHLKGTAPGDVIILDRGYADYGVMAFVLQHHREFVIRLPRRQVGTIRAFWEGSSRD